MFGARPSSYARFILQRESTPSDSGFGEDIQLGWAKNCRRFFKGIWSAFLKESVGIVLLIRTVKYLLRMVIIL